MEGIMHRVALLALLVFWPMGAKALEGGIPSRDEAIALVETQRGFCTGVLVGPMVVLTASHCYKDALGVEYTKNSRVIVGGGVYRVGYVVALGRGQETATDIAIVFLQRKVTNVTPLRIATEYPLATDTVAVFGWGCGAGCYLPGPERASACSTQRAVLAPWAFFTLPEFSTEAVRTCKRDSGGPVVNLRTKEVVGISSAYRALYTGERSYFIEAYFANAVALGQVLCDQGPSKITNCGSYRKGAL